MIDVIDSMTELFYKLRFDEPLNYYNEFKIRLVGGLSLVDEANLFTKDKKSLTYILFVKMLFVLP